MKFQTPLEPATLIRRYKRFLADIRLADGREVTAHCANPGSMMGLAEEGMRVWVEPNDDPKKKLKFGWRLVEFGNGHYACVDTAIANRVVKEAFDARALSGFQGYETVRPEAKYGDKSRIDFLLDEGTTPHYVEVKSVTLCRQTGLAEFPDSVTARGAKHLHELMDIVAKGARASMLFLVQRTDCIRVSVAADIDANYAAAMADAIKAGVGVYAYQSKITPSGITVGEPLEFAL